jgi:hypothetical protein
MSSTLEQVLVGLGTSLVVLAIGLVVKRIPKSVALLLAVGVGMIAYVVWPRAVLVEVPDLSDLSRDEAEIRLASLKLTPEPQPQEAPNIRPEHVVPSSQNPLPGTKVQPRTIVRYSVSTATSVATGRLNSNDPVAGSHVSIFSPKNGGDVVPIRGADNVFRFDVEGTIEDFNTARSSLLLWVQPVNPPSDQPGWYLQRLPTNGVVSISGNKWRGRCQIGNQQFPPHNGDVVEVAVSVAPAEEATRLEARQGPLTVVVLPGVVSQVARLRISLK